MVRRTMKQFIIPFIFPLMVVWSFDCWICCFNTRLMNPGHVPTDSGRWFKYANAGWDPSLRDLSLLRIQSRYCHGIGSRFRQGRVCKRVLDARIARQSSEKPPFQGHIQPQFSRQPRSRLTTLDANVSCIRPPCRQMSLRQLRSDSLSRTL